MNGFFFEIQIQVPPCLKEEKKKEMTTPKHQAPLKSVPLNERIAKALPLESQFDILEDFLQHDSEEVLLTWAKWMDLSWGVLSRYSSTHRFLKLCKNKDGELHQEQTHRLALLTSTALLSLDSNLQPNQFFGWVKEMTKEKAPIELIKETIEIIGEPKCLEWFQKHCNSMSYMSEEYLEEFALVLDIGQVWIKELARVIARTHEASEKRIQKNNQTRFLKQEDPWHWALLEMPPTTVDTLLKELSDLGVDIEAMLIKTEETHNDKVGVFATAICKNKKELAVVMLSHAPGIDIEAQRTNIEKEWVFFSKEQRELFYMTVDQVVLTQSISEIRSAKPLSPKAAKRL